MGNNANGQGGQDPVAKVKEAARQLANGVAQGAKLRPEAEERIFKNPVIREFFISELRSLFASGKFKPNAYLDRLMFKPDLEELMEVALSQPGKTGNILPGIISTSAICTVLLANDSLVSPDIIGSIDLEVKLNRLVFESMISAALWPELKERQVLAHYYIYHAREVMRIKKDGSNGNGFLPMNPLVQEKITPLECATVTWALDPANASLETRDMTRRAFDKFIDLVLTKEAFSPAKRWRDIKRKVFYSIAKSLMDRTQGKRFFSDCDEKTVVKFSRYASSKKPGDREELRIENSVRGILLELMHERGLNYRPLCRKRDSYIHITTELEHEGTFVLPLGEVITITLVNPLSLISKGGSLNDFRFSLEVYVDIRVGDKFDHKTLIREGEIRTRANDGNVIFNPVLDAKVTEPSLAEITIKAFSADGEQYSHVKDKVIVLPEGSVVLIVRDKDFASVIDDFVSAGKLSATEAEAALAGIAGDLLANTGDLSSLLETLAV